MTQAVTWMNLKDTLPRKQTGHQRTNISQPHICEVEKGQVLRNREQKRGWQELGGGRGPLVRGDTAPVGGDETVLEMGCDDDTHLECT